MTKRASLFVSLLLLFALLLSLCPPALAADDDTIHIRTAEDLLKLARDCSLDTWSDGKSVVLDNDLSLSGAGFDSIPTFNGKFDGQGHTIYDMDLSSAQSPCGFFLETGKDADIHDLHLSGSVQTRGDDSMVGGFVGLNRGMLTNCSFSGEVRALTQVGGIAGKNDATGMIVACSASGTVQGLTQTGGIAGENAGALTGCENRSFVNTESVDPTLRLESIDTSSILNFIRSLRTDSAGITTDTGGVAGSSTGFIERCSNTGTVGYLHLGYNVGGIVGRSSGYINGCLNVGDVYGRKDVGGIVGQAEPLKETAQAQDLLAGVGYRIAVLNRSLNDAAVDARYASEDLSASLNSLSGFLAPVAEAVSSADVSDPESAYYLRDVVSECFWNIRSELDAISQGVDAHSGILREDFNDINNNLNALSDTALQTVGVMTSSMDQPEEVLVDSSDAGDDLSLTLGKTASSENRGSVNGDSNVGGIAGDLSVESELDPETDLSVSGSDIRKNHVNLSIVVTGCVNRGDVTAKRECAGGIVGKMDMGLASHCASYGPVTLEDGDYAGGITGLLYGSVKSCCSKCSLSGKRFIGGVVGNGYNARSSTDKSSTVSGCYTLVEILGAPQFAGAVSGGADGLYEKNYFVPADFAGLDRLSIHGQAEPIPFEDFARVEGLPEECRTFTLRFVVDGETVKELPFDYGASFDRSVFPDVPGRDGRYAVWDRTELSDLRFDTTVTASYRLDETVLRSSLTREDGRAVVYVDGQFQQGDALKAELLTVDSSSIRSFSGTWQDTVREQLRSIRDGEPDYSIPVSVREQVHVSFPADGQREHTIRYLTPDGRTENYRLYLKDGEGWQRLHPRTFGSYYLIDTTGTEALFTLVETVQSWWFVAYIAAALLILALLVFLLHRLHRFLRARPKKEKLPRAERPVPRWLKAHRRPLLIILPILLLVGAAAAFSLRFGSLGSAVTAYRVLKDFSRQETDVETNIRLHIEDRDLEMSTTVHRVLRSGHMIRCTEQYGIPLYISDGMVCLENGRVFRLTEGQLSQGKVLDLALDVFLHEKVETGTADGITRYSADITGETADRILRLFLSSSDEELLHANDMTVAMSVRDESLQSISFTGGGSAMGSTPFRFDVLLTPREMTERPVIPQAVVDAIETGGGEDVQILSEDLLRLLAAWIKNESAETVSADIAVNADCGSLRLTPRYRYSRSSLDGTDVHCIKSALFTLFFTDSAACTSDGRDLSEAQQRVVDAAQLIPLARELCLKGQFSCAAAGDRAIYSIVLTSEDAAELVSRLLPELDRLNLSYNDCKLRITVVGDTLDEIALDCGASLRVVSRDVAADVRVTAEFNSDAAESVPAAVKAVLVK